QGRRVPLTLLLGPPGSGKSTVLRQWLAQPGGPRKVYCPVPRREDEPRRFFRALLDALERQVPGFSAGGAATGRLLRLPPAALGRRVPLTLLLGPPGSGKSTVLRQWLAQPGGPRKVYCPVPRREDEPRRFFRALLDALERQVPGFSAGGAATGRLLRLPPAALG